MRRRVDLTSDLLNHLEMIADANQRSIDEQIAYYLEWAITIEWDVNGPEILAKLKHRQQQLKDYWHNRPEEAAMHKIPIGEHWVNHCRYTLPE